MEHLTIILCGIFCICASYFDWDFFFNNYKARPFIKLFGRNGARLFYLILGILLIVLPFFVFHV